MKVKITKELKIKLIKALADGEFDTKNFPELKENTVQIFLPYNGRGPIPPDAIREEDIDRS
ncbi:hypothetical protein KUL156_41750 [Alteromonas sp. KUL156]|nr:hypothetical protein KUL154_09410 [Alteromonas sp. KUL154]GFE01583.1 hypothetical protein KUL156_41750 [Alteromonas sp. KUL156]